MLDLVKKTLTENNVLYVEKDLNHGIQLACTNGAKVNVFNNGTVQVQGKTTVKIRLNRMLGLDLEYRPRHSLTHTDMLDVRGRDFDVS